MTLCLSLLVPFWSIHLHIICRSEKGAIHGNTVHAFFRQTRGQVIPLHIQDALHWHPVVIQHQLCFNEIRNEISKPITSSGSAFIHCWDPRQQTEDVSAASVTTQYDVSGPTPVLIALHNNSEKDFGGE